MKVTELDSVNSPSQLLQTAETSDQWIRVTDSYGNHVWFHSVTDILTDRWVEAYDRDDPSTLRQREHVYSIVKDRWPDVDVFACGPLDDTDEVPDA